MIVERSPIRHSAARLFVRRLRAGLLLLVKHGPVDRRTRREQLMAFVSDDGGRTWQGGLMLDERDDLISFGHPLPTTGVDASRQKSLLRYPMTWISVIPLNPRKTRIRSPFLSHPRRSFRASRKT